MAKVRNVSGSDRIVGGRLVLAGAVLEVPADEVWSYTCQEPNWVPADDEAQATHDATVKASEPAAEPSLDWKKDELEAYAHEHGVDIDDAKTKAEILDAISKHTQEG